jgi:hypothetical protein
MSNLNSHTIHNQVGIVSTNLPLMILIPFREDAMNLLPISIFSLDKLLDIS